MASWTKKNIKLDQLYMRNEKEQAFHDFLRPRSHIYHDISNDVILMCGEIGGLNGQAATKAELCELLNKPPLRFV
jgi:hypothetical protein